jgi:hypothetical protein
MNNVDTTMDRHPSISDYNDLKRLLNLKDFDKNIVLTNVNLEIYNTVMKLLVNIDNI